MTSLQIHPELDTILIKVASRCNIDCTYCYVYHMGDSNWSRMEKLISKETIDATCQSLEEIKNQQTRFFSIVLHGGEPLLLGYERLEYLLSNLRNTLSKEYTISIQTNGVLITNEILDLCSKHKVSMAVSLDGPKRVNDKFRIGHGGKGTFEKVIEGIEKLAKHSDADFLFSGLLAVIDPESAPSEVYSFFKEIKAPSVDFLYKDGNHDRLPIGKESLVSTEYGDWMVNLLNIYLDDSAPLKIRILDDMLKVFLGGVATKEGLGVTDYGIIIIDTDGTVTKNDTLKSTYQGADRFEKDLNIKDGTIVDFLNSEEFNAYRESQRPTSEECLNCQYLDICGGGMTLHRWKKETGFNNPSIYCNDQKLLISYMKEAVTKRLQGVE